MAFHPLGTARADARPAHGVVDGDLALHGVRGVYVADGSVVPSALGVNPQLTIMALATRLAFGLLGRACRAPQSVGSTPARDPRGDPMSFLIDPALLYAGGRTYAATTPEGARPPRARQAARRWLLLRRQRRALPRPAVDEADLGGLPRRVRPRLDDQLRRHSLRHRHAGRRTHKLSAAIFATYPLWLWLGERTERGKRE